MSHEGNCLQHRGFTSKYSLLCDEFGQLRSQLELGDDVFQNQMMLYAKLVITAPEDDIIINTIIFN